MRRLILLTLLGFAFVPAVQSQQTQAQFVKKHEAIVTQACSQEINKDQRIASLTNKQTRQICRCAVPLTVKRLVQGSIRDGDLLTNLLLLDFLQCGAHEIKQSYVAEYRERGVKLRDEYFDVNEAAGICLAKLEYEASIDSLISKSAPDSELYEKQMRHCVLPKE
jgi:hypothetical protein